MPSIRRFCPAENSHATSGLNGDHRRDQIVHKSIVIGPARDPIQPGFEQSKLGVAELICQLFQQENCEDFFFENTSSEELVCDPDEEIQSELFSNPLTEADGHAAQLGRIPAVRLDLVFEEPPHTSSMLDRALVVEQESNLTGDACRGWISRPHKHRLFRLSRTGCPESFVVNPQQRRRNHSYRGDGPPDAFRLVRDFSEMMHQGSAKPSPNQGTYPDG